MPKSPRMTLDARLQMRFVFYGVLCLIMLLVSATTRLPFVVAVAMIIAGAIFPAIYIFRLYYPLEVTKK